MSSAGKTPLGPFPPLAPAQPSDNPHFAALGGTAGITRLVDRFYWYMDHKPCAERIRAMHAADLSGAKDLLSRYLTEWLGGPRAYSTERGHPRLRQRHMPFRIAEAERNAWLVCMRAALAETVPDDELRTQLEVALSRLADTVRNVDHEPKHRQR